MSDQPYEGATQPGLLPAAAPAPPPRSRGWGLFRILLTMISVGGFMLFVPLVLFALLAGMISLPIEGQVQEVHYSGDRESEDKIAIVTVEDVITESTARKVIEQLKKAQNDEKVKAVILKVNTPGGTITASDHIYRKVKQLCREQQKTKPVVVSMQAMATSGGYYVSAPASKIFVEPTTLTGSIGVIASFPNVSGLMDEWKIEMEVIKTGPMKDSGSPFRPMSEQERLRWKEIIGQSFDRFVEIVADGRDMEREQVRQLATGEIFTSHEAIAHKLVDEIGYLEDAIDEAEKLANVSNANVVQYKQPVSLFSLFWGISQKNQSPRLDWLSLLRSNVPRVMYLTQAPTVGW